MCKIKKKLTKGNARKLTVNFAFLGGATSQTSLPSNEMQGTFLNCWVSVDLVLARALNNEGCYNDVDFTRLNFKFFKGQCL